MKNQKRLLALGLTGIMLMSLAACGNQNSGSTQSKESEAVTQQKETTSASSEEVEASGETGSVPEWLNTEGTLPVVKEGTDKKLSIYVLQAADAAKPEDTWMYRYLTEEMSLDLEFTTFTSENRDEFISLAFASGELPDIIIGASFTAAELLKYGELEEQILDLTPYINETNMPNLTGVYEQYPSFKEAVTDAEGNVWSLGFISNPTERGYLGRAFVNYDWLEQCGLEVPETLDEFIDTMTTFKEKGLAEYPIGGSWTTENPSVYILNALGYTGAVGKGFSICLRDGEVVLPYADRERFGEYLKVMNQLYEEGLIHRDFFTMDYATTSAELAKGTGFITQAPFVYTSDYTQYWAAMPLTSEWNDTPQ